MAVAANAPPLAAITSAMIETINDGEKGMRLLNPIPAPSVVVGLFAAIYTRR
jgi:hypothetical protein